MIDTRSVFSSAMALAVSICLGCGDDKDDCKMAMDCPDDNAEGSTGRLPFDAAISEDEACAEQVTRAVRGVDKQVDVIFVVDNSGSMTEEIEAIRANINVNFAQIISASGVDFRVIMISKHGQENLAVCIDPPLSAGRCNEGAAAGHSPVFFHYDQEINSFDPWCKLLETFRRPNQASLTPDGWSAWLRPEAQKAFVLITDDSASCSYGSEDSAVFFDFGNDPFEDALMFHQTLVALSPEHFGMPPQIKYAWYSIVGMGKNDPVTDPYFPHEDVVTTRCSTGASAGESYQALSIITDALRYPVCEGSGFDAIFQVLAANLIETAKADCVFEIPEAPERQAIDLLTVTVEYTPGDGTTPRRFEQVIDRDDCDERAFYIAEDRIRLCPSACTVVEEDRAAEVNVLYGCTLIPD